MKKIYKWLGLVPEAPNDGNFYVRHNREWVQLHIDQQPIEYATDTEVNERIDDVINN